MKAIVYCKFGSRDVLQWEEIQRPAAKDDEVLLKVHAVSVNPVGHARGKAIINV